MGLFSSSSRSSQTTNVDDSSVRTNLSGDVISGGNSFVGVSGSTFNVLDGGAIAEAFGFGKQALLVGASAIDQSFQLSNDLVSQTTGDQGQGKNTSLTLLAVGVALSLVIFAGNYK